MVSYASEVKFDVLGVPEGPVVSEAAARAMADGARRVLGADVGLSITGVAGPDRQDGQPAGTVFVGLARPGHETVAVRVHGARVTGTGSASTPPSPPSTCCAGRSAARPGLTVRSAGGLRALVLDLVGGGVAAAGCRCRRGGHRDAHRRQLLPGVAGLQGDRAPRWRPSAWPAG